MYYLLGYRILAQPENLLPRDERIFVSSSEETNRSTRLTSSQLRHRRQASHFTRSVIFNYTSEEVHTQVLFIFYFVFYFLWQFTDSNKIFHKLNFHLYVIHRQKILLFWLLTVMWSLNLMQFDFWLTDWKRTKKLVLLVVASTQLAQVHLTITNKRDSKSWLKDS